VVLVDDSDDDDDEVVAVSMTGAAASSAAGTAAAAAAGGGEGAGAAAAATRVNNLDALVGSERDAKNVFVELRKAANHPLLLRQHFRCEKKMTLLISRLHANGHFGDTCTTPMVRKELEGYSDLDLHQLCVDYGGSLQHMELPTEALFDSAKMTWLRYDESMFVSGVQRREIGAKKKRGDCD
jgi:SWI/SNF-related matrix-associated actin-dependent regulator 1 of chromatin subfamily A